MLDSHQGQAFVWASWDCTGVVTAAVRGMLMDLLEGQPVRLQWSRASDPDNLAQLVSAQSAATMGAIGLALWNMQHDNELLAVCKSLISVRARSQGPICVCVVEPRRLDWIPILHESGAQIVVSELISLQRALPRVLSIAPISTRGYHPLTTGLVQRLPWSEI